MLSHGWYTEQLISPHGVDSWLVYYSWYICRLILFCNPPSIMAHSYVLVDTLDAKPKRAGLGQRKGSHLSFSEITPDDFIKVVLTLF